MTSWMKERDRLVEQTMAFVEGVAAQRPIHVDLTQVETPTFTSAAVAAKPSADSVGLAAPTSDPSLIEAEALMSLIAMSLPSLRPEPANQFAPPVPVSEAIIVPADVEDGPAVSAAPVYIPAPRRSHQPAIPEREMIAQRVASFRAAQLRLIREREDNYETVQAKIRATLGNDPQA